MDSKQTIVVTGGSGFIGRHLVSHLLNKNCEILVIDKNTYKHRVTENLRFARCDISDVDALKAISQRANFQTDSIVFHLAAQSRVNPSFDDPLKSYKDNITGTANVLEVLCKPFSSKLIYAGSSSYYGGAMANPYAFSKHLGEEMCRMYTKCYGMQTAVARFFNVYGPGHVTEGPDATVVGIFERLHKAGLPLTITGDGEQRRDFIHVSDVVCALYKMSQAQDTSSCVYDVGVGTNYSINELAQMFKGSKIEYIPSRQGESRTTLCTYSSAMSRLGWWPTQDLEKYVDDFCDLVNEARATG
jgi:UDP-glucose 4-epimerase